MKKVKNHEADIKNKNIGTTGVNETFKKANDHKSDTLNPNNEKFKEKKS
ncbi:hypothetical protein [Flavobacterium sp.]|nr:hypothetical protein [Flavobacterium sp.]